MWKLLLVLATIPSIAGAHEAWLAPVDGGLALRIGEEFVGEQRSFRRDRTASLRAFTNSGAVELGLPDAGEVNFVSVGSAGLVAYDSQPSFITLPGDEFTAYLREEGLQTALASRADAGETKAQGRERYRRSLKALLQPGAFATRTGQLLELVPLSDPLVATVVEARQFQLLLRGKPLEGALVRAWSRRGENLMNITARTDLEGTFTIELPHAGSWMLSAVHMARLEGAKDADWESIWASLTFTIPQSSAVSLSRLFHGAPAHGVPGPWVLSGLRMGADALKRLGLRREQAFELEVVHRSPPSVRYTCVADGLMAATGVSPGKLNLGLEKVQTEAELETLITHRRSNRQLVYRLNQEFRDRIRETDFADFPKAAKLLDGLKDEQLFTVEQRAPAK